MTGVNQFMKQIHFKIKATPTLIQLLTPSSKQHSKNIHSNQEKNYLSNKKIVENKICNLLG
jgi:hypothetical protein